MKKILAIMLVAAMAVTTFAGCGGGSSSSSAAPSADPAASTGSESTPAPESNPVAPADGDAIDPATTKVVLICDPVGTNPFLTQMVAGLKNLEVQHPGLSTNFVECADSAVWEDNIRAAVQEENNVIIVAGTQGTDPLQAVASEFPDDATYILIDDTTTASNIKSISFNESEGSYLIGMIAGLVNKTDKFGGVHANEGQSSYKWRWGFMQGVMAARPEITEESFTFNFTNSYTDAAKAKELALQQAAAGCGFINAASAVADFGTFEAAQEKQFYTSGQDEDRTNPDNPYIITTQIKDTAVVIEKVVNEYLDGSLTMEPERYGVKEGVIGALYITHEGKNPRNSEVLTDEIVAQVKEAAKKIANGEILLETPLENA